MLRFEGRRFGGAAAQVVFQGPGGIVVPAHVVRCVAAFYVRKVELGDEPAGPVHAQGVFGVAPARVADSAQNAPFQVFLAAVVVVDPAVQVHGHGVYRKIAAGQVVPQVVAEPDFGGPVDVRAVAFAAESRHFGAVAVHDDHDDAHVLAQLVHDLPAFAAGNFADLFRPGGRRHIEIARRLAGKQVPHGAAHDVGFVTRGRQGRQDLHNIRWEPVGHDGLLPFRGLHTTAASYNQTGPRTSPGGLYLILL